MRTAILTVLMISLAAPVAVARDAGSYLAGRSAMFASDYDEAARYYARALVRDPKNEFLLESAATAYLGLGDLERSNQMAKRFDALGGKNQLVGMILLGGKALDNDWNGLLAALDDGRTVGPLFDGLARAWSLVGAGRMAEALEAFDQVASNQGVEAFGYYHKALALASVGDYEGAARIFSGDAGTTLRLTRRGIVAYAEVLSQLERNGDAVDLIQSSFGSSLDPYLEDLRARLINGDAVLFDAVRTPKDGLAEVFYSIASALRSEAQEEYTLLYARMAVGLRRDHIDALLLTAELLEDLERYALATEVYDTVPRDDPSFHAAELGRADALRHSGREDASIEVLRQLTVAFGHLPRVTCTRGK